MELMELIMFGILKVDGRNSQTLSIISVVAMNRLYLSTFLLAFHL